MREVIREREILFHSIYKSHTIIRSSYELPLPGPVVLPGGMAVVHGYLSLDNEYTNSFKKALPNTWSVATGGKESVVKYTNQRSGAVHVLGLSGEGPHETSDGNDSY